MGNPILPSLDNFGESLSPVNVAMSGQKLVSFDVHTARWFAVA
jgi:hypothetical protein